MADWVASSSVAELALLEPAQRSVLGVQFARRIEGILGWRVDVTHKPIPRSRRGRDRASSSGGALWANQFRRGRDTGRDPRGEGRSAWDIHR